MDGFIAWLAPILSTIITTGGLALINAKINSGERKRDEARAETEAKRAAEAEWRKQVTEHMAEQDEKIDSILEAQCSQMRSDIIHKCHRYLDDLGQASTEEKKSLAAEHDDYNRLCTQNGIVNSFVDKLVERVMELPERTI